MDENKEVNSTDPKREKGRVIPLSAIDDAPDHPFGVRDDEEMAELVESISTFGVINPVKTNWTEDVVTFDDEKAEVLKEVYRGLNRMGVHTEHITVKETHLELRRTEALSRSSRKL